MSSTVRSKHPNYEEMVVEAIRSLQNHKGSSLRAIMSFLGENYSVGDDQKHVKSMVAKTIKAALEKGILHGKAGSTKLTGSFRLDAEYKKKHAKESRSKTPESTRSTPKKSKTPKASTKSTKSKAAKKIKS